MDSKLKVMADDVFTRIKEGAENKTFRVNNAEEWYFICGEWSSHVLRKRKYSDTHVHGEMNELLRLTSQKNSKLLLDKMTKIFKQEYFDTNKQSDFLDGIFLAITSYELEDNEKSFDGSDAFIYGELLEKDW